MRNMIAACFCVLFVCAGCGSQSYWYNEEKSYYDARVDCQECLYQAQREVMEAAAQERKEYGDSPNVHEPYRYTLFKKCMEDKGYAKTWDYKLDYFIRKGAITDKENLYLIAGK